jgi:Na+/melibiose symporter-like transporter
MNQPIHDNDLNRILLKPRFKLKYEESESTILEKFRLELDKDDRVYRSKIIKNHIVVDVPEKDEHFWSPQLHIEIETEEEHTLVKGILGPRPKIWTFFMFLHFVVALAFMVFFVIFYSKWSLDQEHTFSMVMCIVMPVIWVALYFSGQLGKKFGYDQMVGLHDLMTDVLKDCKSVTT